MTLLKQFGLTAVRGFCMGAADIVPGVSGGTVALVFGIYEQLLGNVRLGAKALGSLVKGDFTEFRRRLFGPKESVDRGESVNWMFLLPLLAGLATALVLLASLIEGLLHDRPEEMAGLFFGLVAGSIIVAWGLLDRKGSTELAIMLAVGVAAFILLGFQTGPVSEPPLWAFLGAGMIAICAMILPGVSGSFLLLMMGMYAAVLGAAHDRGSSDLVNLAVFAVGATIGLAFFSSFLGWLLDNHHDAVLAALIGLMIGSFRVLWPWPHGVGIISDVEGESISGVGLGLPSADNWLLPTVLAVVALAVVVGVSRLAPDAENHHAEPVPVGR